MHNQSNVSLFLFTVFLQKKMINQYFARQGLFDYLIHLTATYGKRRATVAATTVRITSMVYVVQQLLLQLHTSLPSRRYDPLLPYAITTFHYLLPLQHAFATCHCRTLLPHAIIHF